MSGKMAGLPLNVSSPVDLGRVIRELEGIDAALSQATLRGEAETELPKMSALLAETVEFNKLNLLDTNDRKLLLQFLQSIRDRAPRIHMSFSADPSPEFIAKLTFWLRDKVHPLVLVTLGLQPNIGAGCVVRTTNKYFDLSLGNSLGKNRELLMSKLREAITAKPTAQPAAPVAEPTGVAR